MSFRYTNSLIGALRHRILLESAQRSIARKIFVGVCKGIEVKCSGFGAIISIQLRQGLTPSAKASLEAYYYENVDGMQWQPGPSSGDASSTTGGNSSSSSPSTTTTSPSPRMLRLDRVQQSVKAAAWLAQEKRRSAKADAINRSIHGSTATTGDTFSSSSPSPVIGLKHWFEDHPDVLPGLLPHQHLTKWLATPWMTAVQYGLPFPDRFLKDVRPAPENTMEEARPVHAGTEEGEKGHERATSTAVSSTPDLGTTLRRVLSLPYCDPLSIPIGSIHSLHTPSLMQFEQHYNARSSSSTGVASLEPGASCFPAPLDTVQVTDRALRTRSRVCIKAVRSRQRLEMCADELKFWDRVELISSAQLASIKTGHTAHASNRQSSLVKRSYKEIAQTLRDGVEEKVELRFTT